MILNYMGRNREVHSLHQNYLIRNDGFSLLELRNLANEQKLSAQCVELELNFLRNSSSPCILHMINENGINHFQVYFGVKKSLKGYRYLMADPARQVYYLDEDQLEKQWSSKAALYFGELPVMKHSRIKFSFYILSFIKLFPKGLLIIIPLLNICTMFLGIALSWVLQRGFNDALVDKKVSLVIAIVLLLLIITLSKGLFAYIKQRLLINLDTLINKYLVSHFISKIVDCPIYDQTGNNPSLIKKGFQEIRKMQNAFTVFLATLLSDGSLILLLLSATSFYFPYAGLINAIYLLIIIGVATISLPSLLYDYANLNELSGMTENDIIAKLTTQKVSGYDRNKESSLQPHLQNNNRYLNAATIVAVKISRMNLFYDWLGTVNVVFIFIGGLVKLYRQNMEYSSFVIIVLLSYFITNLMPRICSALYVIAEGIDASQQYKIWLPKQ